LQAANGQNVIDLCGPELKSQRNTVKDFGSTLGKDISVTEIDKMAGLEALTKGSGIPESIFKYLIKTLRGGMGGERGDRMYFGP